MLSIKYGFVVSYAVVDTIFSAWIKTTMSRYSRKKAVEGGGVEDIEFIGVSKK